MVIAGAADSFLSNDAPGSLEAGYGGSHSRPDKAADTMVPLFAASTSFTKVRISWQLIRSDLPFGTSILAICCPGTRLLRGTI
jgi:hypothetical protein